VGGSSTAQGDSWLCLRRTSPCTYSDTHEVRFTKNKGELPKQTYIESYTDTQPRGNARVSGFCEPVGAGVAAGPEVDVIVGVGDVAGGPRG